MIHEERPAPAPGRLIEVAGPELEFRPVSVPDGQLTGRDVLAYCDLHPVADYAVLQWLPGGDLEEIRPDEPISWGDGVAPRFIVGATDRTFRFQLDDRMFDWPAARISVTSLRKLGRLSPDRDVYLRSEGGDHLLHAGQDVDLGRAGVEILFSRARSWTLNVQGVSIISQEPEIRVRDAMSRAGFDVTAAWIIVLKTAAERRQVDLDYLIDLRLPGIEKLRLTPREINNGETQVAERRQFALLPTDEHGLDERGLAWRTMLDGGRRWLLIEGMPLPPGYNVRSVDVAIEVPVSYPAGELDMFYCHPPISRTDGRIIPQTQVTQAIAGRTFQRWSRHRGVVAPWRPGKDSVLTHLALVDASLTREVE